MYVLLSRVNIYMSNQLNVFDLWENVRRGSSSMSNSRIVLDTRTEECRRKVLFFFFVFFSFFFWFFFRFFFLW